MYSSNEEAVNEGQGSGIPYAVVALCLFLLSWQASFRLPDNCIGALLAFMHHFLLFFSAVIHSEPLSIFAKNVPKNVKQLRAIAGVNVESFTKFVVCPLCHSIYDSEACLLTVGSTKEVKKCQHIGYPEHPHASFRKKCDQPLLKMCKYKSSCVYRPLKVYCSQSIIKSMELLLCRPNFLVNCEQWRHRQIQSDLLCDIYDGQVWKEFLVVNGRPFLNCRQNFAFSLNIDWFQPHKHVTDSVGAIYLSILNLPRHLRYKAENIILCGIIPGPSEPKDINNYIYPIVHELLQMWEGVVIKTIPHGDLMIRAALLCITSDLPATRKLCGFAGHAASFGCSKCLKRFSTIGEKRNYSGFERSEWIKRDLETHRSISDDYKRARTKAQQDTIVKNHGVRYSVLLQLSYFNVVRFHVIDAMHNLLLGTAKNITRIWCEKGLISSSEMQHIQSNVNSINVPVDVGRIPSNIASSFYGFTADQWRNWTCIFSPVVLKNILPSDHLRCWLLFVKATSILCTRMVSIHNVRLADSYLVLFCKEFEKLYGPQCCTPNMHLHLHLCDCIMDYGPVYSFWCFAFERYNGMLGSYPTNSRQIEPQIMKKFIQQQQIQSIKMPQECFSFSQALMNDSRWTGSLLQSVSVLSTGALQMHHLAQSDIGTSDYQITAATYTIDIIPPIKQYVLTCDEIENLKEMYKMLYPTLQVSHLRRVCCKIQKVCVSGEMISSAQGNTYCNSCISALWKPPSPSNSRHSSSPEIRIGHVQYILKHYITTEQGQMQHLIAVVNWFKKHPQEMYFGSSCYVVRADVETGNSTCYIPVQRLLSRCCFGNVTIHPPSGPESVIVAIPIPFKYCI